MVGVANVLMLVTGWLGLRLGWGASGIVQTGFMGLALGVSYLVVGRNLWVTILAHADMDTILMVQMFFA